MQGVAIVLLIVAGFAIFITWARTQTGRGILKQTLGEPHSFKRRVRDARHMRAMYSPSNSTRSKTVSKPNSAPRQPAASRKGTTKSTANSSGKSSGTKTSGGRPTNGK